MLKRKGEHEPNYATPFGRSLLSLVSSAIRNLILLEILSCSKSTFLSRKGEGDAKSKPKSEREFDVTVPRTMQSWKKYILFKL